MGFIITLEENKLLYSKSEGSLKFKPESTSTMTTEWHQQPDHEGRTARLLTMTGFHWELKQKSLCLDPAVKLVYEECQSTDSARAQEEPVNT